MREIENFFFHSSSGIFVATDMYSKFFIRTRLILALPLQTLLIIFHKILELCDEGLISEGGTEEDRRINPPLNFGIFIENNNKIGRECGMSFF